MDDPADRLYTVDLDGFVAERAALAKALRASGDRAAAAEIGKLRKPTAAAWTLNQLARQFPASLGAVLDAAQAIRMATARRDGVREAIAAHREALRAAIDVAQELRPNGKPPSDSVLEKVRAALAAAAMDEALAAALRGGRLIDETDPAAGDATAAPSLMDAGAAREDERSSRDAGAPPDAGGPSPGPDDGPRAGDGAPAPEGSAAAPRGRGKRKRRTRDAAAGSGSGAAADTDAADRAEAARRAQEEERRAAEERRLAELRERRDEALAAADAARTAEEASVTRLEAAQRALIRAEKEHEAAIAAADDAAGLLARAQRELDRLDT